MSRPLSWSAAMRYGAAAFVKPFVNSSSGLSVFDHDMTAACEPDLEKWESNVRPGVALNSGPAILKLADWPEAFKAETPCAAVEQIQADLRSFKEANRLDQVVVVNVTSTEAPFETGDHHARPEKLKAALASKTSILPASGMYAWAALDLGLPYINFTPSLGASFPAADQLAMHSPHLMEARTVRRARRSSRRCWPPCSPTEIGTL